MQYYATVLGRHLTWLNIECQYSGHVNSLCQKVCLSSITISDNFMNLQDTHTVISRFNDDKKNKINKNTANKNTRALDYSICPKPDSVDTNNFFFFFAEEITTKLKEAQRPKKHYNAQLSEN